MTEALYPATEDLAANAEGAMLCRICLGDDAPEQMISPCTCRGSSKFVHRFCLDEWRAQERVNLAFTHCSVCRFAYEFEDDSTSESELRKRKVQFGLLVTRDLFLFFVCVQAIIAGLGFIIHWIDRAENCPPHAPWTVPCNTTVVTKLYPKEWAEDNSISHLRLGPYYVTAFLSLLVLLGMVGSLLWVCGKLPRAPAPGTSSAYRQAVQTGGGKTGGHAHAASGIRKKARRRRKRCDCDCGYCGDCDCDDACFWYYVGSSSGHGSGGDCCAECCKGCGRGCSCDSVQCDNCGGGGGGGGDCGEAGGVFIVIGIALLVVFALIGIIVGIFFSTIIFQRIVQSHFQLLAKRAEAKRYRVKDLGAGDGITLLAELGGIEVGGVAAPACGSSAAPRGLAVDRST